MKNPRIRVLNQTNAVKRTTSGYLPPELLQIIAEFEDTISNNYRDRPKAEKTIRYYYFGTDKAYCINILQDNFEKIIYDNCIIWEYFGKCGKFNEFARFIVYSYSCIYEFESRRYWGYNNIIDTRTMSIIKYYS